MDIYLIFKALHLISLISWMAGLLYLPRIFVYHSENIQQKNTSDIFKTMERKLFNYIMMPSMILTWIFGLLLIVNFGISFSETWIIYKGILVLLLTHYHFYLGKYVRLFAMDQNTKSSKFYRIINEVPTILLILIVFIVVFKPVGT